MVQSTGNAYVCCIHTYIWKLFPNFGVCVWILTHWSFSSSQHKNHFRVWGAHWGSCVCNILCIYNCRSYLTLLWWTLFHIISTCDFIWWGLCTPISSVKFRSLMKIHLHIWVYRTEWVPKIRKIPNLPFLVGIQSNLSQIQNKVLSALCGFALWRRNQHVQHILVLRFAGSAHGPHRHRRRRGLHKAEEGEKAIGQGLQSQLLKGTTLVGKKSHS